MSAPVTEERVSCADGKFTVILRSDGSSDALRYGEAWPAYIDEGLSNLEAALARDLIEARAVIRDLLGVCRDLGHDGMSEPCRRARLPRGGVTMANNPDRATCRCGKGKVSAWDGKCGHCRTKAEQRALYALRNPPAIKANPPVVSALSSGNRALVMEIQAADPRAWATTPLAHDVDKPIAMTVGLLERLLNAARTGSASAAWADGCRSGTENPWKE